MLVILRKTYEDLSQEAARLVADRLRRKPNMVLGLATGSTPLGLYKALIERHKRDGLDFSKVTTFNLDEYIGLPPSHPQSYRYFMQESLFKHINLDPRYTHVPEGKANAVKAAVEGPITATCPASICQMHRRAYFIIDEAARSKLSEVPIEEVTGREYAAPGYQSLRLGEPAEVVSD